MKVTKEQVLERAKEVGVSLTDAEVEQFVQEGKLPEKQVDRREELKAKYTAEQLVEMLLEARGEAKDRRLENKSLKEQADTLTKEIQSLGELKNKTPELEEKLKKSQEVISGLKTAEENRRKSILKNLPDDKRDRVAYLSNVDVIPADQFDATVELLIEKKSPGTSVPNPGGGGEIVLTPAEQEEAKRMNLDPKDYREVMSRRKNNHQPNRPQPVTV